MHNLLTITWDQGLGLDLGIITLRYYSLLFAGGFFAGYFVIKRILANEKAPESWLDSLVTYMVLATVIGARLGHVFFYDWQYYKTHPSKILAVWEGGLASHGAAVAIIIAMIIYARRVTKKSPLWMLDRIVIVVALAGAFIRTGNMMNSEIYGKPANSSIQTVYINPTRESIMRAYSDIVQDVSFSATGNNIQTDSLNYPEYAVTLQFVQTYNAVQGKEFAEKYLRSMLANRQADDQNMLIATNATAEILPDGRVRIMALGVPRYPTQVVEALAYLLIFFLLYALYWRTNSGKKLGFLFGTFLVTVFGFRFFIEFLKANQVAFEADMQFNMGQWLSIPLVLAGLYFMITAKSSEANETT